MRMRVLFFGSDRASLVALRGLHRAGMSRLDVVCPPPKMFGRGGKRQMVAGPVRRFCEEQGLVKFDAPPVKASSDPAAWDPPLEAIAGNYDVGVVVSFGYFLPEKLIQAFPGNAMINLHPSLLPLYRGAAPIQHALMNGDTETGCSIIMVDPNRFDRGDLVRQDTEPIFPDDDFFSLSQRLLDLGTRQLVNVLLDFETSLAERVAQDPGKYKFARKISRETGKIDFSTFSAAKVLNYWRGLCGNGGIYASMGGKRVFLDAVAPVVDAEAAKALENDRFWSSSVDERLPGDFVVDRENEKLFISCKDRELVQVGKLKVEGKAQVDALSFIHGYLKSPAQRNRRFV